MKASINGVPYLSIGDGWWAEGFTGDNGWLIESDATSMDPEDTDGHAAMDAADAEALYRMLEEDVIPTFYKRDDADIPRQWMGIVREAIRSVAPRFSARRMVREYVERMYLPAIDHARHTRPDN
jgi:starch phosphorylase